MANILVVGCGAIGLPVAMALHEKDHRVIGLKRQPPAAPISFPVVVADIREANALQALTGPIDLVLFIVSPGSRDADSYQALYDAGLKNLLLHFQARKIRPKWLMVSSTSVYGQHQGEWVDENSETEPVAASSRWLVAAEQLLWNASPQHCVVRFAGIYGPGRDWLLRRVARGEAIQRQPPLYTNRIHSEDCVAVLLFLIDKLLAGDSLQPCYLACDNDPAPLWEVMSWIAEQYDFSLPEALSLPPEAGQNKRCSNAGLAALGYRFLFSSYRDGYRNPVKISLRKI